MSEQSLFPQQDYSQHFHSSSYSHPNQPEDSCSLHIYQNYPHTQRNDYFLPQLNNYSIQPSNRMEEGDSNNLNLDFSPFSPAVFKNQTLSLMQQQVINQITQVHQNTIRISLPQTEKTIRKRDRNSSLCEQVEKGERKQKKGKKWTKSNKENNFTTHILKSAAQTANSHNDFIQQLLQNQCHNQGLALEDFTKFAKQLYQKSYFSLGLLHQMMVSSENEAKNRVFIAYFKWFLQSAFVLKLRQSKIRQKLEYLRFKNRILASLVLSPQEDQLQYYQQP